MGCLFRDIKLENLLLHDDHNLGTLQLADFGAAEQLSDAQPSLVLGAFTPNYVGVCVCVRGLLLWATFDQIVIMRFNEKMLACGFGGPLDFVASRIR